jgi:hypothetical protein
MRRSGRRCDALPAESIVIDVAQLEIGPLERFDFYAWLDLIRVMEPETETLMRERAAHQLASDEYDSPHSRPWYVSFHGSEFPGEPANACGRYLAYRMMNFPATEPMPPWVTTTGTLGKAGELDIADAWFHGGRMLAVPESPEMEMARLHETVAAYQSGHPDVADEIYSNSGIHQLGFEDPEHWMTVSTDLPILPPGWRRPHIVEVKCKSDDVLVEMLEGRLVQKGDGTLERVGRGPDLKHAIQLKATIGKACDYDWGWVTVCPTCWFILWADVYERLGLPGGVHPRSDSVGYCPRCAGYPDFRGREDETHFKLERPTSGEIYYWSRSWPRNTKSFYFQHDPDFMRRGLEVLAETRDHFLADRIPPRPEHFQWALTPCRDCQFRSFCRLDSGLPPRARKVRPEMAREVLSESNGVDHTRAIRPHYDPHATRERVLSEWSDDGE